jgi:hypothetical protein
MSIITLTNGQYVPTHWNDRFYEATCPECGEEVWGSTQAELAESLEIHC